jgi:hypothetical protein
MVAKTTDRAAGLAIGNLNSGYCAAASNVELCLMDFDSPVVRA